MAQQQVRTNAKPHGANGVDEAGQEAQDVIRDTAESRNGATGVVRSNSNGFMENASSPSLEGATNNGLQISPQSAPTMTAYSVSQPQSQPSTNNNPTNESSRRTSSSIRSTFTSVITSPFRLLDSTINSWSTEQSDVRYYRAVVERIEAEREAAREKPEEREQRIRKAFEDGGRVYEIGDDCFDATLNSGSDVDVGLKVGDVLEAIENDRESLVHGMKEPNESDQFENNSHVALQAGFDSFGNGIEEGETEKIDDKGIDVQIAKKDKYQKSSEPLFIEDDAADMEPVERGPGHEQSAETNPLNNEALTTNENGLDPSKALRKDSALLDGGKPEFRRMVDTKEVLNVKTFVNNDDCSSVDTMCLNNTTPAEKMECKEPTPFLFDDDDFVQPSSSNDEFAAFAEFGRTYSKDDCDILRTSTSASLEGLSTPAEAKPRKRADSATPSSAVAFSTDADLTPGYLYLPNPHFNRIRTRSEPSYVNSNMTESQSMESMHSSPAANNILAIPNQCAICLCDYEPGDTVVTSASCSHAFHQECIIEWLVKMQEGTPCPCCRSTFVELASYNPLSGNSVGSGDNSIDISTRSRAGISTNNLSTNVTTSNNRRGNTHSQSPEEIERLQQERRRRRIEEGIRRGGRAFDVSFVHITTRASNDRSGNNPSLSLEEIERLRQERRQRRIEEGIKMGGRAFDVSCIRITTKASKSERDNTQFLSCEEIERLREERRRQRIEEGIRRGGSAFDASRIRIW